MAKLVSIVTPAYNEEPNVPLLYEEIKAVLDPVEDWDWEWVLVDDHSADQTFARFCELAARDGRLRAVRFSKNYGAHQAVTCGLAECRGDAAIVMAADLQDRTDFVRELLVRHSQGAQIVWGTRLARKGEKLSTIGFSRLYYWIMRNLAKVELPARGSDFFLLDRVVIDAFARYRESNAEIVAILCSMGFRQDTFEYDKEPRRHGSSGWTFSKKLKLVIDSLTAFTYLPIRIMSVFGFVVTALSFFYGMVIIRAYMFGSAVQGWASLMVVILFLGGMQMMMLGVLGEYTWRALDESRARPRHLIEARSPDANDFPPPE